MKASIDPLVLSYYKANGLLIIIKYPLGLPEVEYEVLK